MKSILLVLIVLAAVAASSGCAQPPQAVTGTSYALLDPARPDQKHSLPILSSDVTYCNPKAGVCWSYSDIKEHDGRGTATITFWHCHAK